VKFRERGTQQGDFLTRKQRTDLVMKLFSASFILSQPRPAEFSQPDKHGTLMGRIPDDLNVSFLFESIHQDLYVLAGCETLLGNLRHS